MFQDRLVQCIGIVLSSSKDTVIIIYHWQDSMVACDRAQKCRLIFWLKLPFIATSHFGRSELLMSFQPIHMCLCRFAICLSRANIIYIYICCFLMFFIPGSCKYVAFSREKGAIFTHKRKIQVYINRRLSWLQPSQALSDFTAPGRVGNLWLLLMVQKSWDVGRTF